MRPHLRYLRYILLHKLYVFAGGLAVARVRAEQGWSRNMTAWLWRLLIHDLSKFRPSEWRPYATNFYGDPPQPTKCEHGFDYCTRGCGDPGSRMAAEQQRRRAQFNYAWLAHLHRQPHHWQHWVLHNDDGTVVVLLPDAIIIDEMVADWIGAGTKVLNRPTLAECIAETVKWYAANHRRMMLRDPARKRVEETLLLLAAKYGLVTAALEVRAAEQARASISIPGR